MLFSSLYLVNFLPWVFNRQGRSFFTNTTSSEGQCVPGLWLVLRFPAQHRGGRHAVSAASVPAHFPGGNRDGPEPAAKLPQAGLPVTARGALEGARCGVPVCTMLRHLVPRPRPPGFPAGPAQGSAPGARPLLPVSHSQRQAKPALWDEGGGGGREPPGQREWERGGPRRVSACPFRPAPPSGLREGAHRPRCPHGLGERPGTATVLPTAGGGSGRAGVEGSACPSGVLTSVSLDSGSWKF